jgi:hypothetical protein
MPDVYRPAPKKPSAGLAALPIVGNIVGGMFGGPAGAAAGGAAGSAIAGAGTPKPGPSNVQQNDAIARRLDQLSNDPQKQIRDSINSLQFIQDDKQRADLAKPLLQAEYMAKAGMQRG